jgi:hypothetical protein
LVSPISPLPDGAHRDAAADLALVGRLQSAVRQDERATIVDTMQQAVRRRVPLGGQWVRLSQIAAANGEVTLARQAFDLFLDSAMGDPGALSQKVALLSYIGAWEEAYSLLQILPADQPNPASYAYHRGLAALYVGKSDEARRYLVEANRIAPQWAGPWLSLALIVDFAQDSELTERLLAGERVMAHSSPVERASYGYVLGKAYADIGDPLRAFTAISEAARLTKAQSNYDRQRHSFVVDEALSGYDPENIAKLAQQQTETTDRGILVIGLPRSGTTLVEQILTSHSAVVDGGEIYRLELLIKDIGGISCAAVSNYVTQEGAPAAARLWRHWLDERFTAPGRVVDKTTTNSRLLGIAATLLPEAPLIWITRDRLDCAWSCFRTRFSGEAAWSYDLEDIAHHFRLEDRLLAQWQQILGERLLVVPYEELATEPEPWIRRILAHCNLSEEAQPFAPQENPRAVATASVMQVRQPINRRSIGAAEPYRDFLRPFIKAYHG